MGAEYILKYIKEEEMNCGFCNKIILGISNRFRSRGLLQAWDFYLLNRMVV